MWLYNIGILIYGLLLRVAALWVPKARLWVDGRRGIFDAMRAAIQPEDRVVWVHAASLGEFEQGRPIIEKIRSEYPEYKILVTFFSPSGYEVRRNYEGADYIFYLPLDTPSNARKFIKIAHPEVAVFVKYEYWLNMLFAMRREGVRSYIVSAIFRPDQVFFKWWGGLCRKALRTFNVIYVQDERSKQLLSGIGFDSVVAGDTRFDRVAQVALNQADVPLIEQFKGAQKLFVAGSTWAPDEALLVDLIAANSDIKFVVAPHEIHAAHVEEISSALTVKGVKWCIATAPDCVEQAQVLILDTMGMLSKVYRYADWAYIGGGFGVGIHNTLEAAVFGLPLAFGPNYRRFKEAVDMVELGACTSVVNSEELQAWFQPLRDDESLRQSVGEKALAYNRQMCGATQLIVDQVVG